MTSRSLLRWVTVFAGMVLLTIVMTWPLARLLDRAASDSGDPFILTWTLHYDWEKTFSEPLSLFQAPIFHPSKYALAFSEHVYGIALFCFPFFFAGLAPLTVYNIAVLAGFVFTGIGAFVLCRRATGSDAGAWAGAIFFAFLSFRFAHLAHLQHLWAVWLPLMLAALLYYFERPAWSRALLVGGAFFMNGLTNIHWFLFGSVTFGLTAIVIAAYERHALRRLIPLATALALACLLLLPFLLPYKKVEEMYGMKRPLDEIRYYSAEASDWMRPPMASRLYGWSEATEEAKPERALFPGVMVVALAAAGFFLTRRRDVAIAEAAGSPSRVVLRILDIVAIVALLLAIWGAIAGLVIIPVGGTAIRFRGASVALAWCVIALSIRFWLAWPRLGRQEAPGSLPETIARSRFPLVYWLAAFWVVIGFAGSLGMNLFFHEFLVREFEVFRAIRVPARWAMITYLGLAVLAAFGTRELVSRVSKRTSGVLATLICALLLFEHRAAPVHWFITDPAAPPAYEWIRNAKFSGAVLEFPFGKGDSEYRAMYRQRYHLKPIVNGISGFAPPSHRKISDHIFRKSMSGLIDYLERSGTAVVLVHFDDLVEQDEVVRPWILEMTETGRLRLVGRFDEAVLGAWLFAVTRNLDVPPNPQSASLLRHFAEATPVPGESLVGYVDAPRPHESLRGGFTVFGWAVAPEGVREAYALFDNGAERVPMRLDAYPPVSRRYPWWPRNEKPAFMLNVDGPPSRREGRHDVQIEIVEPSGERWLLPQIIFWWNPDESYGPKEWHRDRVRTLTRGMGLSDTAAEMLRHGKVTIQRLASEWIELNAHHDDATFVAEANRVFLGKRLAPTEQSHEATKLRLHFTRDYYVRQLINSEDFARLYLKVSALEDRDLLGEE